MDGHGSLSLDLGDLPTDGVVEGVGAEPNGAFWEGVAHYVAPKLASRLQMDSEGGLFAVEGDHRALAELREVLMPLVHEPQAMSDLLGRAQADGVTLEGHSR
jgi:hypothetical protein